MLLEKSREGKKMSKQVGGDIPSLSTMSDLGAALPPGNGGTVFFFFFLCPLSPCYCRIFCLFLLLSLPSLFKVIEQNGERSCFETSSLKQFVATIWLDVTIEG